MEKYKLIAFLFSLMLIPLISNSQNWKNGFTFSYGLSKITNQNTDDYQYKISPFSLKLGGFFGRKIKSNSILGFEVLWILMGGKAVDQNAEVLQYIGGVPRIFATGIETQYLHISYLGIPIYYKYNFDKLSLLGGIQPMVLINGRSKNKFVGERSGQAFSTKWSSGAGERRIDFGSLIGIDYKINKRFSLKTEFYLGLIDLLDKSQKNIRNWQFCIGFNYTRK